MTKKKGPPDIPERNDRCCLRANPQQVGTLIKYDPDNNWSTVNWDNAFGPKLCHRFELKKMES